MGHCIFYTSLSLGNLYFPHLLLNILIMYNGFLSYSTPQFFPVFPSSLATQFCAFLKTNHYQIGLSNHFLVLWPSTVVKTMYKELHSEKLSLSQMLSTTSSSYTTDETWRPAPLSTQGFGLSWACSSLVHVITSTVSFSVQLPCCVQKTLFPFGHLLLLPLALFLPPLPQWTLWALGGGSTIRMSSLGLNIL